MLSVMVLYKAVHNTHGFIQYIRMYFDNQCCRSKPVLICMEFYSIRKLNKNCIVIFTNCKNKTKQYSLHNFTVLVITRYIHYNQQKHPQFPLEESSMPQSKKCQQKGCNFRKDDCSLPV